MNSHQFSFRKSLIKRTHKLFNIIFFRLFGGGDIVNGGCIIVKSEGQIVCFTLNDINKFRDYLFNNTKFDTAFTSRHEFGELYKDDKGAFIKLNLDVRML